MSSLLLLQISCQASQWSLKEAMAVCVGTLF